jgi:hypothetical protein
MTIRMMIMIIISMTKNAKIRMTAVKTKRKEKIGKNSTDWFVVKSRTNEAGMRLSDSGHVLEPSIERLTD